MEFITVSVLSSPVNGLLAPKISYVEFRIWNDEKPKLSDGLFQQ